MNSQARRSFLRAVGSSFVVLLILARAHLNAADLPVKSTFNVRDFGAVGDGTNLDRPAIDKAIAAAARLSPRNRMRDVNGLEIDNFKARLAEGVAASEFENVSNTVIRNSPVLER